MRIRSGVERLLTMVPLESLAHSAVRSKALASLLGVQECARVSTECARAARPTHMHEHLLGHRDLADELRARQ
jgi:hypothetical protein